MGVDINMPNHIPPPPPPIHWGVKEKLQSNLEQ